MVADYGVQISIKSLRNLQLSFHIIGAKFPTKLGEEKKDAFLKL